MHRITNKEQDALIAGSLVASPAWVPWLESFNEVLTTATLIIGLAIGIVRLWLMAKSSSRNKH
jgi:hypothetical protein